MAGQVISMTPDQWQQVKTIVQQSLETEPGQRERFLAEKCGGDEFLRAEVNALLAAHEGIGDFIETPAYFRSMETLPMEEPAPGLTAGQKLGHYEIIKELGRGGMGTVYLAQDTELARKVALKILPSGFSDRRGAAGRFRREARVISALNHPNILTIHEIGHVDPIDFIATEFVDGVTLRQRIADDPLPLSEAIEIAAQVAAALSEAHAAGIIHRDIKPENIIIRRDGLVKILDFGIAKLAGTQDAAGTTMLWENNGSLQAGTPKYMSPEQIRGATVDARSDIWSLGIVLYEMLAGHTPPDGVADDIRPPNTTSAMVKAFGGIQSIIGRCLERDTERRYQTAEDVLRDLKELERDVNDDSVKVKNAERGLLTSWQSPLAALFLLAAIAAGLVYVAYFRGIAPAVPEIRNLAILPIETVGSGPETEDYFADGLTGALITDLSQIGDLRVIAQTSTRRYKSQPQSLPQIAQELNVEAVVQATVQRTGGLIRLSARLVHAPSGRQLWERSYEKPERDILALQQEATRDIADKIRIKLTAQERERLSASRPVDPAAYEDYLKGRFYLNKRNEEAIRTAITYFEAAIAKDPDFALPHAFLADAYFALGTELVGAMMPAQALAKGEAEASKAVELDGTLAESQTSLAVIRLYSWRWVDAEDGFKRALELNPNYGAAHSWYALYFASQGRVGEAIARMYRARDLDPLSPHINQNVGWMLHYARQFDEEIEQYNRALELDPNFLFAHSRLAIAYRAKGLYNEAVAEYEKGTDHSPTSVGTLGCVYARIGRQADTRMILDELLAAKKHKYVSSYVIAQLYASLGDRRSAFEWLERGYQERSYAMLFLRVTTDFDEGFRQDPRFLDILHRLGAASGAA